MGIAEQFPPEIQTKRKELRPIMKNAKQDGKRASMVKDKLYIDGTLYRSTVQEEGMKQAQERDLVNNMDTCQNGSNKVNSSLGQSLSNQYVISGEDHSITNSKSAETLENSVITQENESRDFKKKRKKKTGKILNHAEVDINESNNCDNTLNDTE